MANRLIIDKTAQGPQVTTGNFVVETLEGVRVAAFAYKEDAQDFAAGGHCYRVTDANRPADMMEKAMRFSESTEVAAFRKEEVK